MKNKQTRPPAVAGLFYSGRAQELRDDVDRYLASVETDPSVKGKNIRAIIVPHAGYVYSGQTAAYSYKAVAEQKFDAVVIVGPSHREYFKGISVYPGDAYRTPLGEVTIDTDLREELIDENNRIVLSDNGHGSEHCIEVQLPFLQRLYGDFRFVPVIMGEQSAAFMQLLARKLSAIARTKNVLLVASTDLSHYYPYETAVNLDAIILKTVERFDPDELMMRLEQRHAEACGGGPMVSVMQAARQADCTESAVLHYCNSGDVSGDKSAVVGYLAASFN
jgi:MEMO1 family protein